MNKQHEQLNKNSDRGFTIIEVVLVLAIAGLIFLMVFIALPALQRGQRDAQRKSDLSRISTQLANYSSSTRGSVPDTNSIGNFVLKYLGTGATSTTAGKEYIDPSGANYTVRFNDNETIVSPADSTIYYANGTLCKDNSPGDVVTNGPNARNYSLRVKLENQTALYCLDNR